MPSILKIIRETLKLPESQIDMSTGFCLACGMELKDPESISRGYGEVCYNKLFGGPVKKRKSNQGIEDQEDLFSQENNYKLQYRINKFKKKELNRMIRVIKVTVNGESKSVLSTNPAKSMTTIQNQVTKFVAERLKIEDKDQIEIDSIERMTGALQAWYVPMDIVANTTLKMLDEGTDIEFLNIKEKGPVDLTEHFENHPDQNGPIEQKQ
jgi:hypothetical protein